MVAGTISAGKESFVGVVPELPSPKMSDKRHTILTSWASVATALLLVMLVGGAFYTAELKSRDCSSSGPATTEYHHVTDFTQHVTIDEESFDEDFHLDDEDQTELIIRKTEEGDIDVIAVIDYRKQVMVIYLPEHDTCGLFGGIDEQYSNHHNQENGVVTESPSPSASDMYLITDNEVTDLSLIPDELRPFCSGKPTYWMQLTHEENRTKRRDKIKIKIKTEEGTIKIVIKN